MESFFFWFGVVSFIIVSLIILALLISFGPELCKDLYRFFYKAYLKRNDKPRFEVGEIVMNRGHEYKVDAIYYSDMNNDYNFRWTYRLLITDHNYQRSWDDDRSCVCTWGEYITKTGHKKREEDIDKILIED